MLNKIKVATFYNLATKSLSFFNKQAVNYAYSEYICQTEEVQNMKL